MAAGPTPKPIVLRPTPAEFIDNAPWPVSTAASSEHRKQVLRNARWWATCSDKVALAGAEYMLREIETNGLYGAEFGEGPLWGQARARSGDRRQFERVSGTFRSLVRAGVDPTVLLALRGTTVAHPDRLLIATSGMTPTEVRALCASRTLNLDTIRMMVALRNRQ